MHTYIHEGRLHVSAHTRLLGRLASPSCRRLLRHISVSSTLIGPTHTAIMLSAAYLKYLGSGVIMATTLQLLDMLIRDIMLAQFYSEALFTVTYEICRKLKSFS